MSSNLFYASLFEPIDFQKFYDAYFKEELLPVKVNFRSEVMNIEILEIKRFHRSLIWKGVTEFGFHCIGAVDTSSPYEVSSARCMYIDIELNSN